LRAACRPLRCRAHTETAWPEEWMQQVRSARDETRTEITRRRASNGRWRRTIHVPRESVIPGGAAGWRLHYRSGVA
jgi:hypothetical protein